jgi:hypothetical protein
MPIGDLLTMAGKPVTLLLHQSPDRTRAAAADGMSLWRTGMVLARMPVPRSLDEDRAFIGLLSGSEQAGVHLSHVETPADIEKASALLRVAEAHRGMAGRLIILATLDTARAALGLASFNRSIPRAAAFLFDAAALASASGASGDSGLISDLRLRLPLAARASGVCAILAVDDDAAVDAVGHARDGYDGLCLPGHDVRTSGRHP